MILLLSLYFINTGTANPSHKTAKENAYKNQAVWDHAPEIVLCKNQSVFTVKDVEESVKIFKNKKYKKITTRSSCNYEYEIGKIKIVDSKKIDTSIYYGMTRLRSYIDEETHQKTAIAAVVQLDKSYGSLELLQHELGHAFGYQHYDSDVLDIMYSNIQYHH